jgi:hypothetical protein
MKNDIHRTINEADNYRELLEQKINKIKQQKIILNDLYEREINNLNDRHQFLTNICKNSYRFISEYEKYVKQFQLIKDEQANNLFILQIDQILQQQNQIIGINKRKNVRLIFYFRLESKDEISITTNILSVLDNETTIDSNKKFEYLTSFESSSIFRIVRKRRRIDC